MSASIIAYGCYLPPARIARAELARATGSAGEVQSKAVAASDEDALTMAQAAATTLGRPLPPAVRALALAATALPYRRRVQAGLVSAALGLDAGVFISEHTTSTRAGTEALIGLAHLLATDPTARGLLLAADQPLSRPSDAADAAQGAGAAALLLGPGGEPAGGAAAACDGWQSAALENPGLGFALSGGGGLEDVGVPGYAEDAYTATALAAVDPLLARLGTAPADYRFVCLGGAEAKLARGLVRRLKLTPEQYTAARAMPRVGDVGAAGPILELIAALDAALPGDRILLISYGAGSAVDALSFTAGAGAGRGALSAALAHGQEIDYLTYLRLRGEA